MSHEKVKHWETIYETKTPEQVSWTQKKPQTSLDFIESFGVDKSANIIDIGGGDSNLVDHLLELGYTNLSVLDISKAALDRAKTRLGEKANMVNWIHTDILDFKPTETFDIWHDRAAFHFLTSPKDIDTYIEIAEKAVSNYLIVGTFSTDGPLKCSGLEIKQYNEKSIVEVFKNAFNFVLLKAEDHITPFETRQNFLFGSFSKIKKSAN